MATIIAALVAEHRTFCAEFDRVERLLLRIRTLVQVKELAAFVERMLLRHAAAEEDLLLALDEVTPERKQRARACQREHQEIDARLTQVHLARNLDHARRLLQGAMASSRRHFKHEESTVFPFIEQSMSRERLLSLGAIWRFRNQSQSTDRALPGSQVPSRPGKAAKPRGPQRQA